MNLASSTGVVDYVKMESTVSLSGQNPFEELIIPIVDDTDPMMRSSLFKFAWLQMDRILRE